MSSDKLALCHLELTRKLHDLLKDVLRYGEEQLKAHKKVEATLAGMQGPWGTQDPRWACPPTCSLRVCVDETGKACLGALPPPLIGGA